MLQSRIVLSHGGKLLEPVQLLNESHAFSDGVIYPIQALSENFRVLPLFQTTLLPNTLERYLSLLFSYFSNISLRYQDYVVTAGEPRHDPAHTDD